MNVGQIKSIELDRTKPFNHEILFKDNVGSVIDRMKVDESKGWEQFKLVYGAWVSHEDFLPQTTNKRRVV